MVVPRGWTLDDLRDPDLHLFRPPSRADRVGHRTRRRGGATGVSEDSQQLELGGLLPPEHHAPESAIAPAEVIGVFRTADVADELEPTERVADDDTRSAADPDERWTPSFDAADDLGGLLSARSPLLSRAFRGTDRPG